VLAAGAPHRRRADRVAQHGVERPGQRRRVGGRHEQPGHALVDHLGDATDPGRHDGGAARHRLQVDDAERLVDRRAGEHRGVREQLDDVVLWQHLRDPHDAGPRRLQPRNQGRHLFAQLGGVRRAGAEHQLRGGVEHGGGPQQHRDALLPRDPADEDHVWPLGVDAIPGEHVGLRVRRVLGGVYAVADDHGTFRGNIGVSGQDIGAHALRDRHHRGR